MQKLNTDASFKEVGQALTILAYAMRKELKRDDERGKGEKVFPMFGMTVSLTVESLQEDDEPGRVTVEVSNNGDTHHTLQIHKDTFNFFKLKEEDVDFNHAEHFNNALNHFLPMEGFHGGPFGRRMADIEADRGN